MGLRDIEYRYSYDSDTCNIVEEFYDKVLCNAVLYKRIAGFFSSTSFSVAAQGVRGLIDNGGVMKLIISPRVSRSDADIIALAYSDPEELINKSIIRTIDDAKTSLENDYLAAMGWMIVNGYLEIKVAVVYDEKGLLIPAEDIEEKGLFHIKTGVVEDNNGDIISFSGSINETASGWVRNTEQFEVHRKWIQGQEGFCEEQTARFDSYWNGQRGYTKVYSIPEATKQKLIEKAVDDIDQIACLRSYHSSRARRVERLQTEIPLYFYQREAAEQWIANDYSMLFQMATGTGKTRTAIACMDHLLKTVNKLLVIIVCPQNTLSVQWRDEIQNLGAYDGPIILADSTNPKWRGQLDECLLDISLGIANNAIVISCSKTFSNRDFIRITTAYRDDVNCFVIGDEAHGLGATETAKGLLDFYRYRIGLSATPSRWFDEYGSKLIENYFGNKIFEFSIRQALDTDKPGTGGKYLTKYTYKPVYINLEEEEVYQYEEATKKIAKARLFKDRDEDSQKRYEMLLMARAEIYKNAINKYAALNDVLDSLDGDYDDTIVFVSPGQIDEVIKILSSRKIRARKFTKDTGTHPLKKYHGKTERNYVLDAFTAHEISMLVAIKCLDEGIDIPSAKRAIIMASSSNPREFIQRIGRVIRTAPNKTQAEIFDMTVVPDTRRLSSDLLRVELAIFEKEQNRIYDISRDAENSAEVLIMVDEITRRVHGWK